MSSDFIFDRGPAEYFHGRKEIIDTFASALEAFRKKNEGTIFLIQGAPGAGKTALLDVLSKHAKKRGGKPHTSAITHFGTHMNYCPFSGRGVDVKSLVWVQGPA